jgi:hypothetical protein
MVLMKNIIRKNFMKKLLMAFILITGSSAFAGAQSKVFLTVHPFGSPETIDGLEDILSSHAYTPVTSPEGASYYIRLNSPAGQPCDVTLSLVRASDETIAASGRGTCETTFPEGTVNLIFPSVVYPEVSMAASGEVSPKALRRALKQLDQNL